MRTIISVIGKDKPGIIAGISAKLFEMNINILDVSQTIMNGMFTMVMLVDLTNISTSFDEVKSAMMTAGESIEVKVNMQREEIFNTMHNV